MKKIIFAITFFLMGSSYSFAQAPKAMTADEEKTDILQNLTIDVVYLASDYLEGRETGQRGEQLAAEYMVKRFKELGLSPKGENGTWYQAFPFKELVSPHSTEGAKEGTGKNVLAYIDHQAATTIVIGAHYDHLGMGGGGSRHTGEAAIHNGADDNASGVAAMFQIAEHVLTSASAKNNNYLFIGFSGEEMGLFGSKHFVENPTIDLTKVNYMLNMDMIGRLNEEKVLVANGAGTSPLWKDALDAIIVGGLKIKTTDSGVGPSDHTSFYLHDLPVLHFFTGQHMDYHKPVDDSHLVNFEGIYQVGEFIIALIEALDDDGKIAFTKTKDDQGRKITKFKVSLGVMPDYVYSGDGMRIDGIIGGRTAEKAGLKKGDVINKIGEHKVTDIYSYMEGLSKFKAGETTRVIVIRGNKKISKKVTF